MDTLTAEVIEAANVAYGAFETATRTDGTTYDRLRGDAPDWVGDAVRAAHGTDANGAPSMLPDDWRYRFAREAFASVSDASEGDDLDGLVDDFSDGAVPVYTAERLAWLASNLNRAGYADEVVEDLGAHDVGIVERIGLGMYAEAREVIYSVLSSLAERTTETEA